MEDTGKQIHPEAGGVDYDRHEARAGIIAAVSAVTLVVLAVMIVAIYWLNTVTYEKVQYDQYTGVASKELLAIQAREDEQLHRYGYVNKEKGIVRLPIEQAMQMVESDFAAGKVWYNTKTYPVKPAMPAGAAPAATPAPLAQKPPAAATAAH